MTRIRSAFRTRTPGGAKPPSPEDDADMADNEPESRAVDKYGSLKDLRLQIDGGVSGFCFWLFVVDSTPLPATIIHQVYPDATESALLSLDELAKPMLWPLLFIHGGLSKQPDSSSEDHVQYVHGGAEFPLGRWVHIGYQVSSGFLRLQINGKIVKEKRLSSPCIGEPISNIPKRACLLGASDSLVHGYICNFKVQSPSFSIKEHYIKEPPLQLYVSFSSTSEVDKDSDGTWNVVGGKPNGRKTFTVEVFLLDALGRPTCTDMEVVSVLLYADNGAPVEKPFDAEAPLLTVCYGIEFASGDKLTELSNGHAQFKFKISQLSSKCNNRLFRIKFFIPNSQTYPFFEAYSPPIRSISRSRKSGIPNEIHTKKPSAVCCTNVTKSSGMDDSYSQLPQHAVHETVGPDAREQEKTVERKSHIDHHHHQVEQLYEEVHSHANFNDKVTNSSKTLVTDAPRQDETRNSQSDSESAEEENLEGKNVSCSANRFSDLCVFKYCLGDLEERANILKEVAISASDQDFTQFAQQVSQYSGCSHHWNQISITKKLIIEGTGVWNAMSQHNEPVRWETVVFEIQKQFMKIAYTTRSLSEQDLNFLRRVSGCQGYFAHENFEKMWCWLYPVAFTLSRSWTNSLWGSMSPNWIEGFISKEEAELSLQGSRGIQLPGTFILRFPTSRSWPHPDAGNLVVTFVGNDFAIHHRLISLDYIYSPARDKNAKSLQDMLLNEPQLSRLGRVIRSQ